MLQDYLHNPPAKGTQALERLVASYGETFAVLGTMVTFADRLDNTRRVAAEALAFNQPEDSEHALLWQKVKDEKFGPARKELSSLSAYNNRLSYQAAYNAFSTYITDLIKEIYQKNNAILNSKSTVTYREVLRFSRIRDLIDYMIEKRVSDLSYQSIEDLNSEMKDKISFDLFLSPRRMRTISRISEKRNLITHNNAVVNHRYIERTKDKRRSVGERVYLQNGVDLMMYLLTVASDIDARAISKFRLNSRKFKKAAGNV